MKKFLTYFLLLSLSLIWIKPVFADIFTSFSDTQTKEEQSFLSTGQYKTIDPDINGTRVDKIIKWNGYGNKEQHAYAIVQETETQIISTGYGDKDLSKILTYAYDKPVITSSSTNR